MNSGMFCNTAVLQCFYHADISIVKLNVFSNQSNSNVFGWMTECFHHSLPVSQIRFRTRELQAFAGYLSQMLFNRYQSRPESHAFVQFSEWFTDAIGNFDKTDVINTLIDQAKSE